MQTTNTAAPSRARLSAATKLAPKKPASSTTPNLGDMAAGAKAGRNRAVDLYRAVAMLAVAFGHWIAIVAYRRDGELITGNALEFVPSFSQVTWVLQVMPLFFMVGGFASAASLDSLTKSPKPGQASRTTLQRRTDWTASRLARLLPPVGMLATTWLVIIVGGYGLGISALTNAGAVAAAVPLWFLANYVADVIIAPHVLPMFRRSPALVAAGALALFGALEAIRLAGDHTISQFNWILGWFLFQMVGFAWKDGLLPTGRTLAASAAALWAAAVALVVVGPYPITMVSFDGLEHNPTHPPTLALIMFGFAQSATAIAFAPRVTSWLERNPLAWKGVVGANSVAMTIYLWHMTAGALVLGLLDLTGMLSSAEPGTAGWWIAKVPFVLGCLGVLALIVPKLSKIERTALLTPKGVWPLHPALLLTLAVVVACALKAWPLGSIGVIVPCLVVISLASKVLTKLVAIR